ncbi:ABC transporter ATP-binding protein [Streptosporangium lutulentum]|uniref:ABC-2 type transport system ATP-binding protein n=1 Tax=Streptosporangium lutulentum TaxID=1461250 RepID=A0ABT9QMC2_9ACTN|nr:ABC transporter ATP-binding protein [Streptosporangium lutulentum]MDP9847870.1 ABC-2 type transport system ATP-binding protein [Streptosporangium lutulentum]
MEAISVEGVAKSYGDVRAVESLSLRVPAGQVVAVLGSNGAGKSTTVGMMLGLIKPDAGRVEVFGKTPAEAAAAGFVGAMLQNGELVPNLTVREVVGFVRNLYSDPMPLDEVLKLAGLTDLAKRRTGRLSGGQAQRVRFAMAIAGAPRVLVLDEPTAALDVESRRAFWAGMRAYAAGGRTILFATHYLEEADENADRVVVVARGRIVADGTPAEIKQRAGGRAVRFTLGDQPAAGLERLPEVTAVEVNGEVATLHTADPDTVVAALYGTGLTVRDLEITTPALEDAFLSLTAANL